MLTNRPRAMWIAVLLTLALAGGAAAQAGPVAQGQPVTFVGADGNDRGTVTVTGVLDPFLDFPEGKGPEPGTKFVVVTMAIEGRGEDGIEVYPPTIWLHDADGVLWGESLPCCLMDEFPQPELTITTVGPGSRISGFIGYTVPADAKVQQVVYQAEDGVVLIPADLGSARPALGTPVTMTAENGTTAVASVQTVEDPYKKYDKDRPPADGARFVMVTASLENTGSAPFDVETNGVLLRDVHGAVWAPTSVTPAKKSKVPELESVSMGPGDRVSGRLGFQVPADVALEGLYYQGDGRLFRLADLSGAGTGSSPTAEVTCETLTPWWGQVSPILQRLAALPPFQADAKPMDLAASKDMLEKLEAIVADHLAVSPPEPLQAQHRLFLGALLLYAQSARDQVATQEDADVERLFASGEAFEAGKLVMSAAFASLSDLGLDDCPAAA